MLKCLNQTLARLDGERLVRDALQGGEPRRPVRLVAIGKAAAAMAAGALSVWGQWIEHSLVITRHGYAAPWRSRLAGAELIEAGHPLPDADSLRAGERLLSLLDAAGGEPLFLLSGGASALVEVARPGITLDDLQRVNRWLIGSGLPIEAINAVRCRLSRIKGGGLCRWPGAVPARVLLISDVPGDDPALIGSGLLQPGAGARTLPDDLPDWLRDLLPAADAPPGNACVTHEMLANLASARLAAAASAREMGLDVHDHVAELRGDAADTGRELVRYLSDAPPGLHVWGGETSVVLPQAPGRGGRCQHLALSAAVAMAGRDDLCLLAVGTDGSDGATEDAGALVDGGTLARGALAGLNAQDSLRRADAGRFLEACGDLISTGPTGTNVRDLVLALKP